MKHIARNFSILAALSVLTMLAGCGGGDPSINGIPQGSVLVGASYEFIPTIENINDPVSFSIVNKPEWADFDAVSGRLHGSPSLSDVGVYSDITISVLGKSAKDNSEVTLSLNAFSIEVLPIEEDGTITISAYETVGKAPFRAYFQVELDSDLPIQTYLWDFDGDGAIDQTVQRLGDTFYRYQNPGTYVARVIGVDSLGGSHASNQVTINTTEFEEQVVNANTMLFLALSTSIKEGQAVAYYVLNAAEQHATKIELDMNGDGVYDVETTTQPVSLVFYTYQNAGEYKPKAKVHFEFSPPVELPITTGHLNVISKVNPGVSIQHLNDGIPQFDIVQGDEPHSYRANLENITLDNVSKIEWFLGESGPLMGSGQEITYQFQDFYTYSNIIVKVTPKVGEEFSNRMPVFRSYTSGQFLYSLAADESGVFDKANSSDHIEISMQVEAEMSYRSFIESDNGVLTKVLKDWADPPATVPTSYPLTWDGTNEMGQLVDVGTYYLVTEFTYDGKTIYKDDSPSSAAGDIPGYRSRIAPVDISFPSKFAPLHNDPLEITFTLDHPSQIAGFSGYINNPEIQRVLFTDKVFPRGENKVYWGGVSDQDKYLEYQPGNQVIHVLWQKPYPQFPIFVTNDPKLSRLSVEPALYNPQFIEQSQIKAQLDRVATLNWKITHSSSGILVYEQALVDHPSGEVSLTWNGRDMDGKLVSNGKYTHRLVAKTQDGSSIIQNIVQRIAH